MKASLLALQEQMDDPLLKTSHEEQGRAGTSGSLG